MPRSKISIYAILHSLELLVNNANAWLVATAMTTKRVRYGASTMPLGSVLLLYCRYYSPAVSVEAQAEVARYNNVLEIELCINFHRLSQ